MIPQGSLKQLALHISYNPPDNHEMKPLSALLPSFPTTDHLSLAIHSLSQSEKLTHLDLDGGFVISPSLFWPDTQTKPPSWPNLVSVIVVFSMNAANGDWYFTQDDNASVSSEDNDGIETDDSSSEADETTTEQNPDPNTPDTYNERNVAIAVGDEPSRLFRWRADPDKLNPLFEAAAQAAAKMPRLQRMTLRTQVRPRRWFTFAMRYYAPGERTSEVAGARDFDMPRLVWSIGPSGYEPVESILDIWRLAKGEVLQSVGEQY